MCFHECISGVLRRFEAGSPWLGSQSWRLPPTGSLGGAVRGADELAIAALAEFLGNGGVIRALAAADADVVGAAAVRGEATEPVTGTIQ